MAGSKKKKVVQREQPKARYIGQSEDPDSYYHKYPAWNFSSCDIEMWGFTEENIGNDIWESILPFLKGLEKRTWSDILGASKQNHSIDVKNLNKIAQKRLEDKYIEQDALVSLRLAGTRRIYGYIIGHVFNILWYDPCHGDNDTCVCRSHKKHT